FLYEDIGSEDPTNIFIEPKFLLQNTAFSINFSCGRCCRLWMELSALDGKMNLADILDDILSFSFYNKSKDQKQRSKAKIRQSPLREE
ncbi:hypothetical protein, partial [uncultured Allobaculum sp.]|uniref:hypothetical protein n=1 Tax=uncultured Allobaculum sp. TaxID=1187017 RepID=UPI00258D9788